MASLHCVDRHGHCRAVFDFCIGFCTRRVDIPYLWFAVSLNFEIQLIRMLGGFSQGIRWHCGVRWLGGRTVSGQSGHGRRWNRKNSYVGTRRFVLREYVAGKVEYFPKLWCLGPTYGHGSHSFSSKQNSCCCCCCCGPHGWYYQVVTAVALFLRTVCVEHTITT